MESSTKQSYSFNDSLINGRHDWPHFLKNWDHRHHTMISIYDTSNDRFVFFNQSVTNILGYSACYFQHFKALDWISMVHQKEQSQITGFLLDKAPSLNANNVAFQYRIRHHDGHWVYVNHEQNFMEFQNRLWTVNLIIDITGKGELNKHYPYHLDISDRELEVIRLIGSGYSSKEIADKLFISNHTAITHRKNLIRKFKVKNTAQLIMEATKRMLIS